MFAKSSLKHGVKQIEKAMNQNGEEADRLLKKARDSFVSIVENDSIVGNALYNWGLTLYHQAQTKDGEEAQELYTAACQKYSAASVIDPRNAEILNDWGVALMGQARTNNAPAGDALYEGAVQNLLQAETIQTGIASYNLACVYSLRGNFAECQEYLEAARDNENLPPLSELRNDKDLVGVAQQEWFQTLVEQIPDNEGE